MRMAIAALLLSATMAMANAVPPQPPPGPPPGESLEWDGYEWVPVEPKPSGDAAKGLAITAGMIGLGLLARWLMSRRPASGLATA